MRITDMAQDFEKGNPQDGDQSVAATDSEDGNEQSSLASRRSSLQSSHSITIVPIIKGTHTHSGLTYNKDDWSLAEQPLCINQHGQINRVYSDGPPLLVSTSESKSTKSPTLMDLPNILAQIWSYVLPRPRLLTLHKCCLKHSGCLGSTDVQYRLFPNLGQSLNLTLAHICHQSRAYFVTQFQKTPSGQHASHCPKFQPDSTPEAEQRYEYINGKTDVVLLDPGSNSWSFLPESKYLLQLKTLEHVVLPIPEELFYRDNAQDWAREVCELCRQLTGLKKMTLSIDGAYFQNARMEDQKFETSFHIAPLERDFYAGLINQISDSYMTHREIEGDPYKTIFDLETANKISTSFLELQSCFEEKAPTLKIQLELGIIGLLYTTRKQQPKVHLLPKNPKFANVSYNCFAPVEGVGAEMEHKDRISPRPHSVKAPFFVWSYETYVCGCDEEGKLEMRFDQYEGIEKLFSENGDTIMREVV